MITEQDWHEIIAKCQGVSKPNEVAHLLLAAATYMTERKDVKSDKTDVTVGYSGDTEFSHLVNGKNPAQVLSVFEELMDTLSVLSPKLHSAVLSKLRLL